MGRLKRYRTAWSRHHRSRGFGIHSPFAFNFVTRVLGERCPYYAYDYLASLRQAIIDEESNRGPHPRVMSLKHAKMLFRIANHFNPSRVLQIGTRYGLSTASVMAVSSRSRLWLYEPHLEQFPVVAMVMQPFLDDIECYNDLDTAVNDYEHARDGELPFVLVSEIAAEDEDAVKRLLTRILAGEGVVVMRNLTRNAAVARLWKYCLEAATHGQTFTNERLAILVINPKLPLQHFSLWF